MIYKSVDIANRKNGYCPLSIASQHLCHMKYVKNPTF